MNKIFYKAVIFLMLLGCATHINHMKDLEQIENELEDVEIRISELESRSKNNNEFVNDSLDILYKKRQRLLRDRKMEMDDVEQSFESDIEHNILIDDSTQKELLKKR